MGASQAVADLPLRAVQLRSLRGCAGSNAECHLLFLPSPDQDSACALSPVASTLAYPPPPFLRKIHVSKDLASCFRVFPNFVRNILCSENSKYRHLVYYSLVITSFSAVLPRYRCNLERINKGREVEPAADVTDFPPPLRGRPAMPDLK